MPALAERGAAASTHPGVGAVDVSTRTATADRRILFIRSVPLPMALRCLQALRRSEPHARITVLTSPASEKAIADLGVADDVALYRASRFSLSDAGVGMIAGMRARRFDLVVAPHAGRDWLSFWNVGRLALAFGGRETRWLAGERLDGTVDAGLEDAVSFSAWLRAVKPFTRLRRAVLATLKWPLLLLATTCLLLLLTIAAPILFLLVWIAPAQEDGESA